MIAPDTRLGLRVVPARLWILEYFDSAAAHLSGPAEPVLRNKEPALSAVEGISARVSLSNVASDQRRSLVILTGVEGSRLTAEVLNKIHSTSLRMTNWRRGTTLRRTA